MTVVTWGGMSHNKIIQQFVSGNLALHKCEYNGSLFNMPLNLQARFLRTAF